MANGRPVNSVAAIKRAAKAFRPAKQVTSLRDLETEAGLQQAIVEALQLSGYYVEETTERRKACPSCGSYSHAGSGLTRGIPDLLVRKDVWPISVRLGLEIKTARGKLSPEQRENEALGRLVIVRSPEEALKEAREMDARLRCVAVLSVTLAPGEGGG